MLDYKKDARKRVAWKIDGYYIDSCNCDWGCPCQFMARPTHGGCEGMGGVLVRKGNYGQSVSLDNLLVAFVFSYPAAIHEGHGKASYYIDERADEDQFQALSKIVSGDAIQSSIYFPRASWLCSPSCRCAHTLRPSFENFPSGY